MEEIFALIEEGPQSVELLDSFLPKADFLQLCLEYLKNPIPSRFVANVFGFLNRISKIHYQNGEFYDKVFDDIIELIYNHGYAEKVLYKLYQHMISYKSGNALSILEKFKIEVHNESGRNAAFATLKVCSFAIRSYFQPEIDTSFEDFVMDYVIENFDVLSCNNLSNFFSGLVYLFRYSPSSIYKDNRFETIVSNTLNKFAIIDNQDEIKMLGKLFRFLHNIGNWALSYPKLEGPIIVEKFKEISNSVMKYFESDIYQISKIPNNIMRNYLCLLYLYIDSLLTNEEDFVLLFDQSVLLLKFDEETFNEEIDNPTRVYDLWYSNAKKPDFDTVYSTSMSVLFYLFEINNELFINHLNMYSEFEVFIRVLGALLEFYHNDAFLTNYVISIASDLLNEHNSAERSTMYIISTYYFASQLIKILPSDDCEFLLNEFFYKGLCDEDFILYSIACVAISNLPDDFNSFDQNYYIEMKNNRNHINSSSSYLAMRALMKKYHFSEGNEDCSRILSNINSLLQNDEFDEDLFDDYMNTIISMLEYWPQSIHYGSLYKLLYQLINQDSEFFLKIMPAFHIILLRKLTNFHFVSRIIFDTYFKSISHFEVFTTDIVILFSSFMKQSPKEYVSSFCEPYLMCFLDLTYTNTDLDSVSRFAAVHFVIQNGFLGFCDPDWSQFVPEEYDDNVIASIIQLDIECYSLISGKIHNLNCSPIDMIEQEIVWDPYHCALYYSAFLSSGQANLAQYLKSLINSNRPQIHDLYEDYMDQLCDYSFIPRLEDFSFPNSSQE